jgi:hypothetical protein
MPPARKHTRRWLQFSLGTMFVIVSAIAAKPCIFLQDRMSLPNQDAPTGPLFTIGSARFVLLVVDKRQGYVIVKEGPQLNR